MQGRSISTSCSTLFEGFLMTVTSSYKRFTRRRIPLICLPRLFREWSLHITKCYSIYFRWIELNVARLDELRMTWSPGQRLPRQSHWCNPNGVMLIPCLKMKIFLTKNVPILLVHFFDIFRILAQLLWKAHVIKFLLIKKLKIYIENFLSLIEEKL